MAPKRKSASLGGASDAAVGAKRIRSQINRHDVEKKKERFMDARVYGRISMSKLKTTKVNNLLLEEKVVELYESGSIKRLSRKQRDEMLASYGVALRGFADVKLPRECDHEKVSDDLLEYLTLATTPDNKRRSLDELATFLQNQPLNGTEMLGCLEATFGAEHIGNRAKATIYLELGKNVSKFKLDEIHKFAQIMMAFKPILEVALCDLFGRLKGMSWDAWLRRFRSLLLLVDWSASDMDAVLTAPKNDLKSVRVQISRLYKTGKLGELVMKFPRDAVGACGVREFIAQLVAKAKAAGFTPEAEKAMFAAAEERFKEYQLHKKLTTKRDLERSIQTMSATFSTCSATMELKHSWSACIRDAAWNTVNGLTALPHELLIVNPSGQKQPCPVPKERIEHMECARQILLQALERAKCKSYDDMNRVLKPLWNQAIEIDESMIIEKQFFQECQKNIDASLDAMILGYLPGDDSNPTIEQAFTRANSAKESDTYLLASHIARSTCDMLFNSLSDMVHNISLPNDFANGSPVMAKFMEKSRGFVTTTDAKGAPLKGDDAMAFLYYDMAKRMGSETEATKVTLNSLEVFTIFKWMLTPEQQAQVSKWVKRVIASMSAEPRPVLSGSSSAFSSKGKAKAKAASEPSFTRADVLRFFRKKS